MVHDEATVAWGGSGYGAGRSGRTVRSSLPVQRCLLLIAVRCARAEVGKGGTVLGWFFVGKVWGVGLTVVASLEIRPA